MSATPQQPPTAPNPLDAFDQHVAGMQNTFRKRSKSKRPAISTQLKFSDAEKAAIGQHVYTCYVRALDDHDVRIQQWADQERGWREKVGMPEGDQGKSNLRVPITTSLLLAKHAREVDALFGNNPTIEATASTPMDKKQAKKVSLAMKWQIYENAKALKPIALWSLRRLKHGRSFAVVTWKDKYFSRTVMDPQTGQRKTTRECYWSGPDINPLNGDEIILPASVEGKTGFNTVQDAEWVIFRYWDTPTRMLMLEGTPGKEQTNEGDLYQGVRKNWRKILLHSRWSIERDSWKDPTFIEIDMAEGVIRDSSVTTQREEFEILEWHGKWRRWVGEEGETEEPFDGDATGYWRGFDDGPGAKYAKRHQEYWAKREPGSKPDDEDDETLSAGKSVDMAQPTEHGNARAQGKFLSDDEFSPDDEFDEEASDTFVDTDGRRKYLVESDVIVRYSWRAREVVGIQDASEVYPDTPFKRPIFELAMMNDGQYWSQGLIEMSKEFEREFSILANRMIQAVNISIAPPIGVDPALGQNIADETYGPWKIIWTTNPQGIKQLTFNPNFEGFDKLWQMFKTILEELTGITPYVQGRTMEQPNAPRTLGGQRLLAGAADIRLALDMRNLGEDLKLFLNWVFDLWGMYGNEQQFYRVAEGDSQGLFEEDELENGWAQMGAKEWNGRYDFSFKFADDAQVKEGKKQEALLLAQSAAGFPLVQNDPVLQYRLLNDIFDAFGLDFTKYTSQPLPPFQPRNPDDEWSGMLRGETVHVHPQDPDKDHIDAHNMQLLKMEKAPLDDQNHEAMFALVEHIQEHNEALIQKQQMQELVQGIGGMLAAAQAGGAGGKGGAQNPLALLAPYLAQAGGGQQPQPGTQPGNGGA